jgi:hypothetical protein
MSSFKDTLKLFTQQRHTPRDISPPNGSSQKPFNVVAYIQEVGNSVIESIDPQTTSWCLLFMIIDLLPYEDVWKRWLSKFGGDKINGHVSTLFHAKFPQSVKSSFVREYLIKTDLCPEWGSIEIVKAQIELLRAGITRTDAAFFVFVSESCLPMVSIHDLLSMCPKQSILNCRSDPENGYVQSLQFAPLEDSGVPREAIRKSDQWCVITRADAKLVLQVSQAALPFFKNVRCADEMFFATVLHILRRPVSVQTTTYVEWEEVCSKSPKYLSWESIRNIVGTKKYLFARKFKPSLHTVESVLNVLSSL